MRWWESPIVLALAGALAIHTIAIVAFDVAIVYAPRPVADPPPHVELIDVALPPPPPPPAPPPPASKPVEPPPEPPAKAPPTPPRVASTHRATPPTEPDRAPPQMPPPPSTAPAGGHEQTYALPEDSSRDSMGKHGAKTDDRIGPRGAGSGTGSGSGSGSTVEEAPRPVSVATIKTRAKPKGDYAYFNNGASYPAEAKQFGIEGQIKVQLIVDDTGRIKKTRLLTRLGHGLDELALQYAAKLEFEPARDTDDRAVTSVVVWTFDMTLPK